jgi:diaminopimelate decarboxylase
VPAPSAPAPSAPPDSLAARLGTDALAALQATHGPSLYLIDTARIGRNVAALVAALSAEYPRVAVCHSYKTNYVPAVARAMADAGALPEVVSEHEFDLALRLGAPAASIVVNGPAKTPAFLERALLAGALVNVDGPGEADAIAGIARRHPHARLRTGLRCNVSIQGRTPSRFGIDTDGDTLEAAAAVLRGSPGVRVEGLHCHVGGDRSAESYAMRTRRLIELADRLFPDAPPEWIDVGGGLAGPMPAALRAQYETPPPVFADYARAIGGSMRARWGEAGPTLVVEPGMGLLSDVMEFVCRVEAVKRIGSRWHATVSGSVYNVKPTLNRFDLPVEVLRRPRPAAPERRWIVGGSTCMEIDVMHAGLDADLAVGDSLSFRNTGAYTLVLTPPFINPAPAALAVDDALRVTVARRAETLDDLLRPYATDPEPRP